MGLFSSKKKYYAYAGSSQLIEDEDIPNTLIQEILEYGRANDPQDTIGNHIRFSLGIDYHARAKSMFRYAARYEDPLREGGYIRGLPTSNQSLVSIESGYVEAALGRAIGEYSNVLSINAGQPSEPFLVNSWINDKYSDVNYFPFTSGSPDNPDWDEFQETIQIPVVNPDTGLYYVTDNDPTYSRVVPFGPDDIEDGDYFYPDSDRYRISFSYTDNNGDTQIYQVAGAADFSSYEGQDLVQVRYTTTEGSTEYWIYVIGSNVDPEFETAITVSYNDGEYLPVAVLMQDQQWIDGTIADHKGGVTGTPNTETELYITTRKLIKNINIDFEELKSNFLEQEVTDIEEGNASSAKKWDFFIHFAVPIHSKRDGPLRYLWEFFKLQEDNQTSSRQEYESYVQSGTYAQPYTEVRIEEAGESGYNVAYRWSYIESATFDGQWTYTDINYPDAEADLKPKSVLSKAYSRKDMPEAEYREGLESIFGVGLPIGVYGEDPEEDGYHDYVIFTRQNPEVDGQKTYTRMVVMGLSMEYTINTRIVTGSDYDYRYRYANVEIFDYDDETAENYYNSEFRIPILYGALKDVGAIHREEVCAEGLTATVFLVEVVKVKWYQRGFFKWLAVIIIVVLIALSIIFYLEGGGLLLKELALALAVVLGVSSAIAVGVIFALLSFAVGFLISVAATLFDPTIGAIFAAIASFIIFGGLQEISGQWANLMNGGGWGSALQLLGTVSTQLNSGMQIYYMHEMDKLMHEMEDWTKSHMERMQELQDIWAGVGPANSSIDPLALLAAGNVNTDGFLYETPANFYSRTLNANPGVMGYDLVYYFPAIANKLPTGLHDTDLVGSMMRSFAAQRGAV